MAISYDELNGSGTVSFAGGTATATRIFNVDWDDAFDFADEVLGGYGVGGGYKSAGQYPYLPHLKATEAEIEGMGKPNEATSLYGSRITYDRAKVTVKYEPQLLNDEDDPQTVEEENVSVSVEMMTLPSGSYEYTADSVVVADSAMPGLIMPSMQYTVSRKHVSQNMTTTAHALIGKVNDDTFRGFDTETVLFAGISSSRKTTTDGTEDWEIDYNFLVRPQSWNHIYRDSAGTFVAIRTKTGHNPIYADGDFTGLVPAT